MTYMLDTNICIYAIKNNPEQVLCKIKEAYAGGFCIPAITLTELEHGAAKSQNPEKNQAAILRLIPIFEVLPFDDFAAVKYGKIRAALEKQGTPIDSPDMPVAAHAKAAGRTIVTNNAKGFAHVPGFEIKNWAS